MINWLLRIGLVVTPFIFAPGRVDPAREPKMAWALVFALAISLTSLYKGLLKPFKNRWAFILVGLYLLSFYLSPNAGLKLFGMASGRFWSWEPMYQGIIFLLFTITVASIDFNKKDLNILFDIMVWCGMIMATLVILQFFYLDQFFEHRFGTYGRMAGTLGNPTLIGPYLMIVVPLALYRRRYVFAIAMLAATIMTRSDVALAGFVVMILSYIAFKSKKLFVTITVLFIILISSIGYIYTTSHEVRQIFPDNERFLTWSQAIEDIHTPIMTEATATYPITGIGPGSFKYIFHARHNSDNDNFIYAHNEFVNVIFELGIAGLIAFLMTIGVMLKQKVSIKEIFSGTMNHRKRAMLASFMGIMTCAIGSFVWQIGTHIFYTLIVIGFLYNQSIEEVDDA